MKRVKLLALGLIMALLLTSGITATTFLAQASNGYASGTNTKNGTTYSTSLSFDDPIEDYYLEFVDYCDSIGVEAESLLTLEDFEFTVRPYR